MTETTRSGTTRQRSDRHGAGPASPVHDGIAEYIALVREHLADLPADDVEKLTAGLEGDLTARVAESGGSVSDQLGSPPSYAEKLRRSAGHPPAAAPRRGAGRVPGRWRHAIDRRREANPTFDAVAAFTDSLRPAWWLVRGVTAATLLVALPVLASGVGVGLLALLWVLAAVIAAVLSVRYGRHVQRTGARLPATLLDLALGAAALALGAGALVMVLGVLGHHLPGRLPSVLGRVGLSQPGTAYGPDNFYVYDANGHRVPSARVYDADGNPVRLSSGERIDPSAMPSDFLGAEQPNAYPRRAADRPDPWADPDAGSGVWVPPASIAPLVPGPNYAPPVTPPAKKRPAPASTTAPTASPSTSR